MTWVLIAAGVVALVGLLLFLVWVAADCTRQMEGSEKEKP